AVVEHRRLVLLALADHDDAAHADAVEHEADRVDGRLVGALLVAAPDPARGVAIGGMARRAHGPRAYILSGASTPTRSRQRAITVCVARQRASRNACCSLSSTRCSW